MGDFSFEGVIVIAGELECVSGLSIGAQVEDFEIGGLDNPVIKDPVTGQPYVPGSSLKGKLRTLLEWSAGKVVPVERRGSLTAGPHQCSEPSCPVCTIFGTAAEQSRQGPTRLIVRDAFATPDTLMMWDRSLGPNLFTEIKSENTLDRVTSRANPRQMERVPAGSRFALEMTYFLYAAGDRGMLESLVQAMALLEDSALGGSGTRGSGRIRFREMSLTLKPRDWYLDLQGEPEELASGQSLAEVMSGLKTAGDAAG